MRGRHAAPPTRFGSIRRAESPDGRLATPRASLNGRGGQQPRLSRAGRPVAVSPIAVAGLAIIAVIAAFCFAGPLLHRPDLVHVNLALSNRPPGGQHLLGTDPYGVDVLGKLRTGGQVCLEVGAASH